MWLLLLLVVVVILVVAPDDFSLSQIYWHQHVSWSTSHKKLQETPYCNYVLKGGFD